MKKIVTSGLLHTYDDLTMCEKEVLFNKEYDTCIKNRILNYPSITDYLDAQAKGDTETMEQWVKEQLGVKSKFPKPNKKDFGLE